MTTEEIAQKVLDLLFHEKLPDTQAFEGIFGTHLGFKISEEQQAEVKRFLLNTTSLCETVSNTGFMHVIKLSPMGWKVMTEHGSYTAYLEHLKQEEIQRKLEQEQQAAKEADNDKRAREQELRELRRDTESKAREEQEAHRWKAQKRLSVLGIVVGIAAVVVPVVFWSLEHNQYNSNEKETTHKVETMQQDVHAKPLPTSLDTTVADSMNMTVKRDSVPSDSIKGKRFP